VFLFRGALMSRLTRVVPTGWALFAQASLFGLWHYGAATYAAKGNVTVAFSTIVVHQTVFGYAMGFVALRTRSLLVASAFHTVYDTIVI